jgi:cytochrome c oxidase assembly protein subunit 15
LDPKLVISTGEACHIVAGGVLDPDLAAVLLAAAFAAVLAVTLTVLVRERSRLPGLLRIGLVLSALLAAQGIVGEVQWRTRLPWGVVLAHVALAGAVWATTVALAALAFRPALSLLRPRT